MINERWVVRLCVECLSCGDKEENLQQDVADKHILQPLSESKTSSASVERPTDRMGDRGSDTSDNLFGKKLAYIFSPEWNRVLNTHMHYGTSFVYV